MHLKKHVFIATILTVYLGRIICGETLHLLSCCDRHYVSDSTSTSHSAFCNSDRQTDQGCRQSHSIYHQTEEHYPTRDAPHDPSECWMCHVLSEASDTSFEITLDISDDFVWCVAANYEHWYLRLKTYRFLVRGPPQFLLQQS